MASGQFTKTDLEFIKHALKIMQRATEKTLKRITPDKE